MCNCEKIKEALLEFYEKQEEECKAFCYGGPDLSEECEKRECHWVPIFKKAKPLLGK